MAVTMTDKTTKLEPWQEGMPCRFRGDGLCIANCAAACRCLSPAFLWAEAVMRDHGEAAYGEKRDGS